MSLEAFWKQKSTGNLNVWILVHCSQNYGSEIISNQMWFSETDIMHAWFWL